MLQQSKALFERELKSVQEELGKLSTNSSVAEVERSKSEEELKTTLEALEAVKGILGDLESQLKALKPLFPAPLGATVENLLNRLPADPANTKAGVSERMQTVVGILNEVDKFNNAILVSNEKQPNEKGELLSVDVIYLGLGQAFFVAPTSDFAGVGVPSPDGWKWTRKDDLAGSVRRAVAMYRNQTPAEFLALPVTVQ
jgi:ATP-dependent exoDNAse (exonuclease V) beta subunit